MGESVMDLQQYRNVRAEAEAAAQALRAACAASGLPESATRGIRAVVSGSGTPYVHIGVLNAGHVRALLGQQTGSLRRL